MSSSDESYQASQAIEDQQEKTTEDESQSFGEKASTLTEAIKEIGDPEASNDYGLSLN